MEKGGGDPPLDIRLFWRVGIRYPWLQQERKTGSVAGSAVTLTAFNSLRFMNCQVAKEILRERGKKVSQ